MEIISYPLKGFEIYWGAFVDITSVFEIHYSALISMKTFVSNIYSTLFRFWCSRVLLMPGLDIYCWLWYISPRAGAFTNECTAEGEVIMIYMQAATKGNRFQRFGLNFLWNDFFKCWWKYLKIVILVLNVLPCQKKNFLQTLWQSHICHMYLPFLKSGACIYRSDQHNLHIWNGRRSLSFSEQGWWRTHVDIHNIHQFWLIFENQDLLKNATLTIKVIQYWISRTSIFYISCLQITICFVLIYFGTVIAVCSYCWLGS